MGVKGKSDRHSDISLKEGDDPMAMFDPVCVTKVMSDILSRRGVELILVPKGEPIPSQDRPEESA